jgi:hypothetical protein
VKRIAKRAGILLIFCCVIFIIYASSYAAHKPTNPFPFIADSIADLYQSAEEAVFPTENPPDPGCLNNAGWDPLIGRCVISHKVPGPSPDCWTEDDAITGEKNVGGGCN